MKITNGVSFFLITDRIFQENFKILQTKIESLKWGFFSVTDLIQDLIFLEIVEPKMENGEEKSGFFRID